MVHSELGSISTSSGPAVGGVVGVVGVVGVGVVVVGGMMGREAEGSG